MQSNNTAKIIAVIVLVAVVLVGIGYAMKPERTERVENNKPADSVTVITTTEIETITSSSSVESDMDAYIKASDNPSNPNDFNDSYSDLNQ